MMTNRLSEVELLKKINDGVPDATQRRYNELIGKRNERALTHEEYDELLKLTDHIEILNAKRLKYLIELAEIQNKPILMLMEELKVKCFEEFRGE